jgi:hypothetical protein
VKLNVFIDDQPRAIEIPDSVISEASDFFAKMDADMDKGWQMGRTWVDDVSIEQRCQIAADKLLTAIEGDNEGMQQLMTAYILFKLPNATDVRIDTSGEMLETEFIAY